MKRVLRQREPDELARYRRAAPSSTWEQMKSDLDSKGPDVYAACRAQLIADQGGICAFCEIDIRDNDPLKCRIEHFHPKSDTSEAHNWALDWNNLLGVCSGGSNKHGDAPYTQKPLTDNLSCDAHKDQMIQSGKLPAQCEGWIINPAELVASSCLFGLEKSTGKLSPDPTNCAASLAWPGNCHPDLQTLVQHTIDMLNLNCDRLCQARLAIIKDIERNKKKQRKAGYSAQQGLTNLANRYLRRQWPGFFTTIHLCLGAATETCLANLGFLD
ncbi:MAG: TIGR02646 family protein [Nitrosomonas sp.]|uniref:retron system putative HNH endonuclease n=1 Tax=Nitrosomonas sp. TaxID=42353 RepID=UPI0025E20D11|nr:retron system putative HNH endonuclease [Nitrosomonas sp.]MBY0473585.1 TIGR02646 family protein [Nitrosomonas sp.]